MKKKQRNSCGKRKKLFIFAASFRGIRRKDDNLYDLQGRFEPQQKRAITLLWWLCFCILGYFKILAVFEKMCIFAGRKTLKGEKTMAKPIEATPVLEGTDALAFIAEMEKNEKASKEKKCVCRQMPTLFELCFIMI